jgi:hypothetical protein
MAQGRRDWRCTLPLRRCLRRISPIAFYPSIATRLKRIQESPRPAARWAGQFRKRMPGLQRLCIPEALRLPLGTHAISSIAEY